MKIISISCNKCGGPLNINENTKFVTCNYCSSQLKIEKSNDTIFTEVIEKVEQIKVDIDYIKLQNEVFILDREWNDTKELYMRDDQNGKSKPYTFFHCLFEGIFYLSVVLFLGYAFLTNESSFWTLSFFIIIALCTIYHVFRNLKKALVYRKLLSSYKIKRKKLLNQINENK